MAQFEKKEITKKSENISKWYNDVVLKAELADYGPVRGTMVIRPYGYAIWERVQEIFNRMMKKKGVQNAYFPLFIPHSLLEKEKEHVKGFSPELAIVTIGGGEELKDPLVVRPTSETIMYEMYAKWIHSWRDLPLLINQWNNVVRWEKRTYLFLRTLEFLWQEGHTAHETEKEAIDMAKTALEWYRKIYEDYYAVPVVLGTKSEAEKFAGAKTTYTVEALMPDGKALQVATSHNLGQNFSKVFNISFQNKEGKNDFVWQTSWGLSTRSLGGLFLVHGDNSGLKLPPNLAPIQVVIIPIFGDKDKEKILQFAQEIKSLLESKFRVEIDDRDNVTPGFKFNYWELKGIPLRIEIGQKEQKSNQATLRMRDPIYKDTSFLVSMEKLVKTIEEKLADSQRELLDRASKFLEVNTHVVSSYEELQEIMKEERGFIKAFWCEDAECEEKIKEETKATARCLPLDTEVEKGKCVYCGKSAVHRWLFAQAY